VAISAGSIGADQRQEQRGARVGDEEQHQRPEIEHDLEHGLSCGFFAFMGAV
jgi:hypothetical protein